MAMQPYALLFVCGILCPLATLAAEFVSETAGEFRLNGFATLVATQADSGGAADYRSANYLSAGSDRTREWDFQNDSILGLQALWSPPVDGLTVVAQGVLANDTHDDFKPRLDWLFVGWQPSDALKLRAGRTPFPAMMDSEVRWLGHARLTTTPQPETYFHLPMTSLDGASLRWRRDFDSHYLQLRAGAGQTDFDTASRTGVTSVDLRRVTASSIEFGGEVWRAYIGGFRGEARVQSAPLARLHDSLSALAPGSPIAAEMAAAYPTDWFPVSQLSLGFEYLGAPWSFKTEAVRRSSDTLLIYAVRGWYAVGGYTIGAFTPFVTAGRQWQDSDLSPKQLPTGTPGGAALSAFYNATLIGLAQRRVGAGVRYDLPGGAVLKLQYDRLKLDEANSRGMFVNPHPGFIGRTDPINVLSLALDYQF